MAIVRNRPPSLPLQFCWAVLDSCSSSLVPGHRNQNAPNYVTNLSKYQSTILKKATDVSSHLVLLQSMKANTGELSCFWAFFFFWPVSLFPATVPILNHTQLPLQSHIGIVLLSTVLICILNGGKTLLKIILPIISNFCCCLLVYNFRAEKHHDACLKWVLRNLLKPQVTTGGLFH